MEDKETKPVEDEGTEPKEEEEKAPEEEPQEEEPKEEIKKVEEVETTKGPIEEAVIEVLDDLAEKGLDQIENEDVKGYLVEVWGDLKNELPGLFEMLAGEGEIVLGGKYLDATKAIMKKIQDDILSFHAGNFDKIDFEEIIEIRRAAIFSLYNAQRISQVQPSLQKFLSAASRIAEILLSKGIPYLLALV